MPLQANNAFVVTPGKARSAAPLDIFGDLIWIKLSGTDRGRRHDTGDGFTGPRDQKEPATGPLLPILAKHGLEFAGA